MTDTGAGTPLRDAIKADLTALAHLTPEDWAERRGADPIARTINAARDIVDARFDAARSRPPDCGDHYIAGYKAALAARPATDPAGLDVERAAIAAAARLEGENSRLRTELAACSEAFARLSVADGPGPEERRALVNDYDTIVGSAPIDRAALSRPLPENREEPSR